MIKNLTLIAFSIFFLNQANVYAVAKAALPPEIVPIAPIVQPKVTQQDVSDCFNGLHHVLECTCAFTDLLSCLPSRPLTPGQQCEANCYSSWMGCRNDCLNTPSGYAPPECFNQCDSNQQACNNSCTCSAGQCTANPVYQDGQYIACTVCSNGTSYSQPMTAQQCQEFCGPPVPQSMQ